MYSFTKRLTNSLLCHNTSLPRNPVSFPIAKSDGQKAATETSDSGVYE